MKYLKSILCFFLLAVSAIPVSAVDYPSSQDQLFFENQVSETPKYPGGDDALVKYVRDNLRIPIDDIENRTRGRIVVSYVIRRDGSIDNVKVVKGINSALNSQVVKLIQKTEDWTPGRLNGHPVDVQRNLIFNVICG